MKILNEETIKSLNEILNNKSHTTFLIYMSVLQFKGWINENNINSFDHFQDLIDEIMDNNALYPEVLKAPVKKFLSTNDVFAFPFRKAYDFLNQVMSDNADLKPYELYNLFVKDVKTYIFSDIMNDGEIVDNTYVEQFLLHLAEIKHNESVYIPFANDGILTTELSENTLVQGLSMLGYFNVLMNDSQVNIETAFSAIEQWNSERTFDVIISHIKSITITSNDKKLNYDEKSLLDWTISNGLNSLKYNGRLILSINHLIGDSDAIQYAIDNNYLDKVIKFEVNYSDIEYTILVFSKNRMHSDFVSFIDSRKPFLKTFKLNNTLNFDFLVDLIRINEELDSVLKHVHIGHIRENEYNLNVSEYTYSRFLKKCRDIATTLNNYCTTITNLDFTIHENVLWLDDQNILTSELEDIVIDKAQLVSIETISENYQLFAISSLKDAFIIGLSADNKPLIRKIGSRSKDLEIFYPSKFIAINNRYIVLQSGIGVNIQFLIYELNKQYISEQIKFIRQKKGNSNLNIQDVMNIKIQIPNISEQNQFVDDLNEINKEMSNLRNFKYILISDDDSSKVEYREELYNKNASLNHTLGLPRQRILSNADNILHALSNPQYDEFSKINAEYKEFYGTNIKDSLLEIKNDINYISQLLKRNSESVDLYQYALEDIQIDDFIQFVESFKATSRLNYSIEVNFMQDKLNKIESVKSNIELLKIVMDNIISNAIKYGFTDDDSLYKIHIDLNVEGELLYISIKNNGEPFPKGFSKDSFKSKFATSNKKTGTGIGGYDINRILNWFDKKRKEKYAGMIHVLIEDKGIEEQQVIEYYNKYDWKLLLNHNEEYPVEFIFCFEII